ncbi:hypothetical protein H0H87_000833 [Tephrocybe sp. NHM501043]|nr:hypothetical protein H0H87_000833 [Tephrocybe sp. NHM501043]
MIKPIQFYDISSKLPGKSWSANTWRIRYALAIKGLPFETTWVDYQDIEHVFKDKGFLPTSEGTIQYTLPAIHDPNTSKSIADSVLIADYLDSTYPDTPKLFPEGSKAQQVAFIDALPGKLSSLLQFTVAGSHAVLNHPQATVYYRRTREAMFGGSSLEDIYPKGNNAKVEWEKVKAAFEGVHTLWLEGKGKSNGPYFTGSQPAFVDIALAALVQYLKRVLGPQHELYNDIMSWSDGWWGKLVADFEKYEVFV